jgi:hypothetical protein
VIVSRLDGALLVIRQPDHGTQTGLISRAWGNAELPPLAERAAASSLAATHHEDGWSVWERRPDIDPATGHPTQFLAVRPREHITAYRAGIERASQLDPWTGLLVSMHGAGLYNDRYGTYRLEELGDQALTEAERALVDEFLGDMADLQHRLFGEVMGHRAVDAPHVEPQVVESYLLLQVWDRISLQFALRHAADGAIGPVPVIGSTSAQEPQSVHLQCRSTGRFALSLDPYPFTDDVVTFPIAAARVPDRTYRDPEDFLAVLAAATPMTVECTVTRG